MCTAQSKPIIEDSAVSRPIMKLVPVVDHPPPLVTSSRAVLASFLGAMTRSGMMMANNPTTCKIKMGISANGRIFDKKTLTLIAIATAAITSKVPCQGWGS